MSPVSAHKPKLIEVLLPLDVINKASAREKSIRHGHPSTLHLWWARRPLAACRAVLWASLVDDPLAHPERFPTKEDRDVERKRLFGILEDLVTWENSNNPDVLRKAIAEVERCAEGELPAVLDPFAGGGSIPLEAQRLGLKALASDLNPVAVLINRAVLEIPQHFAGRPPVHPDEREDLSTSSGAQATERFGSQASGTLTEGSADGTGGADGANRAQLAERFGSQASEFGIQPSTIRGVLARPGAFRRSEASDSGKKSAPPRPRQDFSKRIESKEAADGVQGWEASGESGSGLLWRGAHGLAADIRAYGAWMRDEAEGRIGYLYPDVVGPDGEKLTPIAWIWARTVESPDPTWNGQVPLVKSWTLRKAKGGKPEVWVEPVVDHVTQSVGYRVNNGGGGRGVSIQYSPRSVSGTSATASPDDSVGSVGAPLDSADSAQFSGVSETDIAGGGRGHITAGWRWELLWPGASGVYTPTASGPRAKRRRRVGVCTRFCVRAPTANGSAGKRDLHSHRRSDPAGVYSG